MSRKPKTVRDIINNDFKSLEKSLLDRHTSVVVYGCCGEHVSNDICYKRLGRDLNNRHGNHKHLHSLLRYLPEWFDYESLFADLNEIFSGVFDIDYYIPSDDSKAMILKIQEKIEFKSIQYRFSAYQLLLVLIRLIDRENESSWNKMQDKNIPYTSFKDVAYDLHSKNYLNNHSLNDVMKNLGVKSAYEGSSSKMYDKFVDNYFETLRSAFSRKVEQEPSDDFRYSGQTATFNYIRRNYAE